MSVILNKELFSHKIIKSNKEEEGHEIHAF